MVVARRAEPNSHRIRPWIQPLHAEGAVDGCLYAHGGSAATTAVETGPAMSWSEQVWKGHCPDNLVAMLPDALHDNVAPLDADFSHILARFHQRCMAMSFSDRLLDGLDHLGGHTSELQDSLLSQQLQPLDA